MATIICIQIGMFLLTLALAIVEDRRGKTTYLEARDFAFWMILLCFLWPLPWLFWIGYYGRETIAWLISGEWHA